MWMEHTPLLWDVIIPWNEHRILKLIRPDKIDFNEIYQLCTALLHYDIKHLSPTFISELSRAQNIDSHIQNGEWKIALYRVGDSHNLEVANSNSGVSIVVTGFLDTVNSSSLLIIT